MATSGGRLTHVPSDISTFLIFQISSEPRLPASPVDLKLFQRGQTSLGHSLSLG